MRREVAHLTGEAEYCHRRDAESVSNAQRRSETEQQRLHAAAAYARRQSELDHQRLLMADTLGVNDSSILEKLQEIGYAGATVSLVYLLPLVWVAWVDGRVTRAERKIIKAFTNAHGVLEGTPAFDELTGWLGHRPSEALVRESWATFRRLLEALPAEESSGRKATILQECRAVAQVSGLVFRRICTAERRLLALMERGLMLHSESPAPAGFP
jgi:hypothetical protein